MTLRTFRTIKRGTYGQSIDSPINDTLVPVIRTAVKRGLLDAEYVDFDRKMRGWALNYDIYDVGKKPLTILLQRRQTYGDKYGLHPTKQYLLLKRVNGGRLIVEPCPANDQVVKLAKRVGEIPGAVLSNLERIAAKREAA